MCFEALLAHVSLAIQPVGGADIRKEADAGLRHGEDCVVGADLVVRRMHEAGTAPHDDAIHQPNLSGSHSRVTLCHFSSISRGITTSNLGASSITSEIAG